MNTRIVASLSPLCLCLLAGPARAALEPFSFGASETVQHQSNFLHADDANRASNWLSTTEFSAALNEEVGRDKLVASAAVDFNRYRYDHSLNSTGYRGAAEFDWNTVGDLSGALGADANRRQYIYGQTGDVGPTNLRNLQTDTHAFARVALGGQARWTIYGGADANQRKFSSETFVADEERQWSTYVGTNYSTSPDLVFGLNGTYVSGEYPHGQSVTSTTTPPTTTLVASRFSTRSVNATTKWQASGNSALDASIGYTTEDSDALSSSRHFANGSLNWTWKPPSHFTVVVGLKRSSDVDTSSTGANVGVVNANNLNGTSVNNVALLEVTYALTAKISLDASANYTQRRYSDVRLGTADVNGSTRTSNFYLSAHYRPTRTIDLNCGGGRENRRTDASLTQKVNGVDVSLTPAYTDNTVQCAASIRFE